MSSQPAIMTGVAAKTGLPALMLGAIGLGLGHIGTSPPYTV